MFLCSIKERKEFWEQAASDTLKTVLIKALQPSCPNTLDVDLTPIFGVDWTVCLLQDF